MCIATVYNFIDVQNELQPQYIVNKKFNKVILKITLAAVIFVWSLLSLSVLPKI